MTQSNNTEKMTTEIHADVNINSVQTPNPQSSWLLRLSQWLVRKSLYTVATLFILFALFLLLDFVLPLDTQQIKRNGFSTVVTASDGTALRAFTDRKGVWRYPIKLKNVSSYYREALLNYEDRWFYYHPGVNIFALMRASWQRLSSGRIISGGSTITMQVARLIDPHSRSIPGKIKQIFRAFQLEWHFSKKQILTMYINIAPFGGTVEGVEAGSLAYLGKSAKDLSHAEAALLAVLPQAPTRLRPDLHPKRAQAARNKVIQRMAQFGIWSQHTAQLATLEKVIKRRYKQPMLAPILARRMRAKATKHGTIKTTIDASLQITLEQKLTQFVASFPVNTSAAILVVDNKSFKVRAYVASADFNDESRYGHVDMITASRSPGSTLKPFLYGLAIEDGLLHSHSLLSDAPVEYNGYRPGNFHANFRGPVSVKRALQLSLNVPAVQVLYHYTPKKFVSRLRNGGLKLTMGNQGKPNLSVILGGAGTTLETLVTAYTSFANNGLSGKLRYSDKDKVVTRRMMGSGAAWIIRDILNSHNRPGIPEQYLHWAGSRKVAWKTGTSYGYRDAWAVGVTEQYTIGVWVGRPDGTPMPGQYGAITAAPILFDVVDTLPTRHLMTTSDQKPDHVKKVNICWPLGLAYDPNKAQLCHELHSSWTLHQNTPPTLPDLGSSVWRSREFKYWINPLNGKMVNARCTVKNRVSRVLAKWPNALEPWLALSRRLKSRAPLPDPSCPESPWRASNNLQIVGISPQTIIRQSGPNAKKPKIELSALGGYGKLYWIINGKLLATTQSSRAYNHTFAKPGRYEVTVTDSKGRYDSVSIKVIP